ncbi:MAG: FecCD family ABC transporter permease [Treponemataceae bacterium]
MKMHDGVFAQKIQLSHNKKIICIFALIFVLIAVIIFALTKGAYKVQIKDILRIYLYKIFNIKGNFDTGALSIILNIRTPRILMAAVAGASLSLSGLLFQGVFRNPLVEPYILGISSGAACGAAFSIVFGFLSIELCSFFFSILAIVIAYFIATKNKETPLVSLILSGLIVSSIFTSILNYLKIMSSDSKLRELSFWLMGGFYVSDFASLGKLFPIFFLGFIISLAFSWKLNILSMGNEEAKSLGVNTEIVKIVLILTASILCSTSVSQVGIISWVGLMIPHVTRLSVGPDHRFLVPVTVLVGAIFMVICDTIARSLIMGEIPISIVTSIIGSPYLIFLLRTNKRMY